MDADRVSRFVKSTNAICKSLVHADIVGPPKALFAAVTGLILLIVEERVQFVIAIATPPALIFEADGPRKVLRFVV